MFLFFRNRRKEIGKPSSRGLFVVDGHLIRKICSFWKSLKKVDLVYFASHTLGILQPLEVNIFVPMKGFPKKRSSLPKFRREVMDCVYEVLWNSLNPLFVLDSF